MKTTKKLIICITLILIFMLILPIVAVKFIPGDSGMGVCFLLFFIFDPALCIALGIIAGTSIKKLWWIPLAASLAFPLLFSLAITEMVWDLFLYSVNYLGVGILAMLGTYAGIKLKNRRSCQK